MHANVTGALISSQAATANHALLAMWGRNAWLLLTDLDELLSTRVPSSVVDMLKEPDGCLLNGRRKHDWWKGPPEQVHLDLVDVYCPTCGSDTYSEADALTSNDALSVLQRWTVRYAGVAYDCQFTWHAQ